ncbi:GntG family PLP-dependent aldolase [Herbidospora cretacea]|uniref:GntG family PLP-dependent aldolase n=1 Tax=Herbidospora cretacea TaxID=28444 RepID=UPI0007735B74|nr:GntG family PLP-dependent aldolase [Herbidospora cretacea]
MIEMRSDTFTLPTPAMRRAMADAEVGDDVYGEDPTVNALEERTAALLGKERACLMPSGTMANLTSVLAHCPRGTKVLVGAETDIYLYEAHGAAVVGGVSYEPLPNLPDGRISLDALAAGFPEEEGDPQFAEVGLICLENTHNRCGGAVLPPGYAEEVRRFADERGVPVHLDGARLFNAAAAMGVSPAAVAGHADSVQFCLSKGLGAPIGSMVAGSEAFVARVRRLRKMLGGGMRQAGILAAAAMVALDTAGRLAEDHEHARLLAKGLADVPGVEVDPSAVQTNIVLFRVAGLAPPEVVRRCRDGGLSIGEFGHGRLRAVTHLGVTRPDVDTALDIIRTAIGRDR